MGHRLFSLFQERRELEELSGRFVFAIVDIATDKLLGNVFFMDVDSIYRIAEAGIFIGDGDARGKGIGTQALKLLLSYGFDTLNLHSINLHVHADNLAAIRCYEKAGFKEYGRRTESVFKNGAYVDMVSMQILDRDFRNH
jgi:RimJ/RimL family protein N-acetyltransferase